MNPAPPVTRTCPGNARPSELDNCNVSLPLGPEEPVEKYRSMVMNTASPPRRSLLMVAMEDEDARVGARASEPSTPPRRASPRGNNERNARIVATSREQTRARGRLWPVASISRSAGVDDLVSRTS